MKFTYRTYRKQKDIKRIEKLALKNKLYVDRRIYLAKPMFEGTEKVFRPRIIIAVYYKNTMIGWGLLVDEEVFNYNRYIKSDWMWRYVKSKFRRNGIGSVLRTKLKKLNKGYVYEEKYG